MKKYILTVLFCFLAGFASAQSTQLSGQVLDAESNLPLEYATITLYNLGETTPAQGGITDAEGKFSLSVKPDVYKINIEYISFQPFVIERLTINQNQSLGVVKLSMDVNQLNEIELVGEKTQVEFRLDKQVYNIGKDLTVRGGSVSDVLDNLPSVSVDIEGNVALRNNTNVRILINGKPSGLVGLSSNDALRQFPADSVEKVEIITSPSARYDAEGTAGIINIVLAKNKISGFNGSVSASLEKPFSYGLAANLNFRTEKFNWFLNSGYSNNNSIGRSYNDTEYINANGYSFLTESRIFDRVRSGYNSTLGVEWSLTDKTSVTISTLIQDRDNTNLSTNDLVFENQSRNLVDKIVRLQDELEEDSGNEYNFNLTHNFDDEGHVITFDAQFEKNSEVEDAEIGEQNFGESMVINETNLTSESQTRSLFQADYVKPIGENGQFEFGYRGNFSLLDTDYIVTELDENGKFVRNTNLSNNLIYDEKVNAVYSQYGNKIGKLSFLMGLRYEHSTIDIEQKTLGDDNHRKYANLFPTLNLSWEISEGKTVTIGYNRRISRPRSRFINPFPSRSSKTNIFQGNPNLNPTFSNGIDVGFLSRNKSLTIGGSVFYRKTTDNFVFVLVETGQTVEVNGQQVTVLQRSPINLASETQVGVETNGSYSFNKNWRMNGSLNLFDSKVRGSYNNIVYDADNFSWSGRFSNTLKAKGIDWQTSVIYRGPSKTAQGTSEGILFTNTALSKDVFKEKGTLTFRVSDLFNSSRRKSSLITENTKNYSEFQWRQRTFSLNFTYRFNQKKEQRQRGQRGEGGGDGDFGFDE